MKVILLENLRKIGNIGDIIEVKRGFARNFLIVNNKALYASKDNIKKVEKIKAELGKKDLEKKRAAKELSEKIHNKLFNVEKQVTENKELYGSVKPTEISKVLEEIDKVKINPSLIQPSEEIKSLGEFNVLINLHAEVQTQIVIKTVAQEEIK